MRLSANQALALMRLGKVAPKDVGLYAYSGWRGYMAKSFQWNVSEEGDITVSDMGDRAVGGRLTKSEVAAICRAA